VNAFERVGSVRCQVGESPLWSAREAAWYWVDIVQRRIWRFDPASGETKCWTCAEMVACMAQCSDGGFIAGMETGIFRLNLGENVGASLLASPDNLEAGAMRFNDGRCDRQGRFWSGTMWMDSAAASPVGKLYRYSAGGLAGPFADGLLTQNGLGWSPDGCTMYLSDSHPMSQQVWAYDYDTETGMPSNRRGFIDMREHPGRPDGAAIDIDGCYWTCANDAGLLLRFTPEGKLDRKIELPMAKPTMCSFGGPGLDTLMVTSIAAGQPAIDEWAGATLLLRPGVQGVAETLFG
jgi:sugar lactone lactonase YvrE